MPYLRLAYSYRRLFFPPLIAAVLILPFATLAWAQSDFKAGTHLAIQNASKGDKLNLRADASATSSVLTEIPPETASLVATGQSRMNGPDKWIEVRFGSHVGWVHSRFVQPTGASPQQRPSAHTPAPASTSGAANDFTAGAKLRVEGGGKDDKLNLRAEPSATSQVLGALPANATDLVSTGRSTMNGPDKWLEIKHGDKVGWVHSRFVRPAADLTRPPKTEVPDRTHATSHGNASEPHSLLPKDGTELRVHGTAAGEKLNVREFANIKSAIVLELPADATGLIATGRTSKNESDTWLEIKHSSKQGWVNSRFVREVESQETSPPEENASAKKSTLKTADPKIAQSADPVADCNSSEAERKLRGCSALIEQTNLTAEPRLIALSRRADSYLERSDFDRSITDLSEALKLQPVDAGLRTRLSHAYYLRGLSHSRGTRHEAAISDYKEAVQLDPKNDQAFFARAYTYVAQGKHDEAITDLSNWLRFGKTNDEIQRVLTDLYQQRAAARFEREEYASAADDCTAAIALAPNKTELYLMRASIYLAQNEQRALFDADRVLAYRPENVQAYLVRGQARLLTEDFSRAISDFSEVLKAQPRNTGALLARALAYERLEQFGNANQDYKRVIRIEPKNATAQRNLKRVTAFAKWKKSRD